jgi:hypothetical protein
VTPSPDLCAYKPLGPGAITPAEALDDVDWFANNPRRHYRLRPKWAVRRHGKATFLRAPLIDADIRFDDGEACAERLWWLSAWPELDTKIRAKLIKAARRKGTP